MGQTMPRHVANRMSEPKEIGVKSKRCFISPKCNFKKENANDR